MIETVIKSSFIIIERLNFYTSTFTFADILQFLLN
jgi:hypothetical protein